MLIDEDNFNGLIYRSDDDYFGITESVIDDFIVVVYTYSTIDFSSTYFYDIKGNLAKYTNSNGSVINYDIPIKVIRKPRLFLLLSSL